MVLAFGRSHPTVSYQQCTLHAVLLHVLSHTTNVRAPGALALACLELSQADVCHLAGKQMHGGENQCFAINYCPVQGLKDAVHAARYIDVDMNPLTCWHVDVRRGMAWVQQRRHPQSV